MRITNLLLVARHIRSRRIPHNDKSTMPSRRSTIYRGVALVAVMALAGRAGPVGKVLDMIICCRVSLARSLRATRPTHTAQIGQMLGLAQRPLSVGELIDEQLETFRVEARA